MDLATVGKSTRLGQRVAEGKISASLCLACSLENQALNLKLHVLIPTRFLSFLNLAGSASKSLKLRRSGWAIHSDYFLSENGIILHIYIYIFIYLFVCLFIYLFICLFIYLLIYLLFIYLFRISQMTNRVCSLHADAPMPQLLKPKRVAG